MPEPAAQNPDPATFGKPPVIQSSQRPGEELLERRTATSKTFVGDEPGQLHAQLFDAAVHFKNAQGRWVDIDDTLAASKDGRRTNAANVFGLSVADSSTDKALARLAVDDQHSVGFALDGAAEAKAKGDANSVTYAKVHKDTDVRLTSLRNGVKEELVLASPAAPDRFVFPLELKGLTAALNDTGDVIYRDEAGVERARTPHGFMTDANLDPRSQEAPTSLGVTYALIPFKGGTALEVRLDRAWLNDPARAYPVTVDPQLWAGAASDDTFVMSGTTFNNSHDLELKVGTYDGGVHVARSFMHFNAAILAGATIQSADLKVAEKWAANCAYGWPGLYRVTQAWNGNDMQTFPGAAFDPNPMPVSQVEGSCPNRTVHYNALAAANHWAANGSSSANGVMLGTNEADSNFWRKMASTEAGLPAILDVWYNHPPAVPYGVTPAYNAVEPRTFTSTTSASAYYADPNGGTGTLAFGLWNVNSQMVWSAWSAPVCSGCQTTIAIPAQPDGWYHVRALASDGQAYSELSPAGQWFYIDTRAPSVSELTPAQGASGASPAQVSARYSEPNTFSGKVYFWLRTTGGASIVEAQYVAVANGAVAALNIPNLAPGTYNLWAMASDGGQNGPLVGPNTFTVVAPTTTTTVAPTTTTTTVPPPPAASGAGAMGYYSFDSYGLTDTLSAQVNVGTGNLMISGADASVATVGGAKGIGRTYNTASLNPGYAAPASPVLGPGWRFSESPDHGLVANANGSVTYVTTSGATPTFTGSPLVAPAGFDAALVREVDGTFTMTFPASADVLRFRADGLLTSETDRNGNVLAVNYPAGGGHPTTITGNAGVASARTLTVDYGGPAGKIASLTRTADGVTASVGYAYDAAGRLETVTDSEGGLTTFVYDAANRITMITDAADHVTRFGYDAAGRVATVTREVSGANAVTGYDYTSTPGHTKVTDPNNNPVTDFTFFADGRMDKALNARGITTQVLWTPDLTVQEVGPARRPVCPPSSPTCGTRSSP
ncbi:MAG: RHS repeat domain-containing protein [Acidimicrobiales bacterium]